MIFYQLDHSQSRCFLRCGNKIVNEGDTTIEVELICGQPFDSELLGQVKR
ncbi:DUF2845 domain-containing protein [Glaciecola sp. 33A]|nr:hypothetical protein CXF81_04585 [Glaciecola sp. 33A]